MKLKFLLFLLFAALIGTTVVNHVRADDDDEDAYDEAAAETAEEAEEEEDNDNMYEPEAGQGSVHPLTDMPEASPDIIAAYVFPQLSISEGLPIGEETKVVVGLINNGEHSINVTRAMGSINSPFQFSYHVQNFTMRGYQPQVEVPPGEERTVEYVFTPRDDMEASDHTVCLTVFYEDDEETFSTQFFNSTVKFYEPSKGMDAESVFSIFLGVVFVSFVGYFASSSFMGKKGSSYSSSSRSGNDEDWVNSSYLESKTARKSSKGSPRKSKKKSN
jgi:hypothetical protein|eukprot:g962.t1